MWPNPQFPTDLVTFTEGINTGKLHFCGVFYSACFYQKLGSCLSQTNSLLNKYFLQQAITLPKLNNKTTKWHTMCSKLTMVQDTYFEFIWNKHINLVFTSDFTSFLVNVPIFHPPENTRKSLVKQWVKKIIYLLTQGCI